LPKPRTITKQQNKAIRGYVKQGLSANKIQKRLQKQQLGIRRKDLLGEIRKIKHQKPKADRLKYTPRKYRKRVEEKRVSGFSSPSKASRPAFFGKHIAVYRYASTSRHPKPYSARFEFYGSGKDLAKAVKLTYNGIVPRYERPYVECSARAFLNNPFKYGERGFWTARPNIES
jgi:hypothetical protein